MIGPAVPALLNITELTCRDDFFERNFTCLPRCDLWDGRPQDSIATLENIVRPVCTAVDLLASGLVLLIFVMRRKVL